MATSRVRRRQAMREQRREAILEAAWAVVGEGGAKAATVRAIADRAGYAPGAIYLYYESRRAIIAALMCESLRRLGQKLRAADGASAAFATFFRHFQAGPADGAIAREFLIADMAEPLTPALDRQVNGRLIAVLTTLAAALRQATGIGEMDANRETVAFASFAFGVLTMAAEGRLDLLGFPAEELIDRRIDQLLEMRHADGAA